MNHTTSSGVTIKKDNTELPYLIQNAYGGYNLRLTETQYRELIMHGMAYFENKKSKDGR